MVCLARSGPIEMRDDLAAVLFLQAQRFFERVRIWLVGLKSDVGFANPRAAVDNRERRIFRGNLLYANADFQECILSKSCPERYFKRRTEEKSFVALLLRMTMLVASSPSRPIA